jgi:hypothetical protein
MNNIIVSHLMKSREGNRPMLRSYKETNKPTIRQESPTSLSSGSVTQSIGQELLSGFSMGVGSRIAQHMVDSLWKPASVVIKYETEISATTHESESRCNDLLHTYVTCLKERESCVNEYSAFHECIRTLK